MRKACVASGVCWALAKTRGSDVVYFSDLLYNHRGMYSSLSVIFAKDELLELLDLRVLALLFSCTGALPATV